MIFSRAKVTLTPIEIHLNARLQPMHRGELFEDPLHEFLRKRDRRSEVTGGGTSLSPEYEVLSCDIEAVIAEDPNGALGPLVSFLEGIGAPIGSYLTVDGGERIALGTWEGTALYVDGTETPPEEADDLNQAFPDIVAALKYGDKLFSWWNGPTATALYFYGASHEVTVARVTLAMQNRSFTKDMRFEKIA